MAAIPTRMAWDTAGNTLTLEYDANASTGTAPTIISVPAVRTNRGSVTVLVNGQSEPQRTRVDPGRGEVQVDADPALAHHTIMVQTGPL